MTAAAQLSPAPLPAGIFTATFRPAPHWSRYIQAFAGVRCRWRRVYVVGSGAFAGEWACVPQDCRKAWLDGHARRLAWAAESELELEREERTR